MYKSLRELRAELEDLKRSPFSEASTSEGSESKEAIHKASAEKKRYFEAWRKNILLNAELCKFFQDFLKKYEEKANDDGFISTQTFKKIPETEKYLLCKSWILIRGFGVSIPAFIEDDKNLPNAVLEIIKDLPEAQRYELAKLEIVRSGTSELSYFNLSSEQQAELEAYSRSELEKQLPSIPNGLLEEIIQAKDYEALQYLIFKRLSGTFKIHQTILYGNEALQEFSDVFTNVAYPIENMVADFKVAMNAHLNLNIEFGWFNKKMLLNINGSLIRSTDEESRNLLKITIDRIDPDKFTSPPNLQPRPKSWSGNHEEKSFTHGGGYFNSLSFFNKKATPEYRGYPLEKASMERTIKVVQGHGIQVEIVFPENPQTKARHYATTRAARCFDLPAIVSGRIDATRLDAANNGHEAGLRPEFIDDVTELSIVRLSP